MGSILYSYTMFRVTQGQLPNYLAEPTNHFSGAGERWEGFCSNGIMGGFKPWPSLMASKHLVCMWATGPAHLSQAVAKDSAERRLLQERTPRGKFPKNYFVWMEQSKTKFRYGLLTAFSWYRAKKARKRRWSYLGKPSKYFAFLPFWGNQMKKYYL